MPALWNAANAGPPSKDSTGLKSRAADFAVKVIEIVEGTNTGRKHYRLFEQIEASSASVSMNLAQGKADFPRRNLCSIAIYSTRFVM